MASKRGRFEAGRGSAIIFPAERWNTLREGHTSSVTWRWSDFVDGQCKWTKWGLKMNLPWLRKSLSPFQTAIAGDIPWTKPTRQFELNKVSRKARSFQQAGQWIAMDRPYPHGWPSPKVSEKNIYINSTYISSYIYLCIPKKHRRNHYSPVLSETESTIPILWYPSTPLCDLSRKPCWVLWKIDGSYDSFIMG